MEKRVPRIVITAPASGTGKTTLTCGLLAALIKRGVKVKAFKCGPDYIDTMFHREVLGIDSYNLDAFLCGKENLPRMLAGHTGSKEMAVIEGVMGYYDGLAGVSVQASTYETACETDSPAVLLADCKGASVSVVPYIQGFLRYREKEGKNSQIQGIILNRISPMMYGRLKGLVERETGVKVYGYLPVLKDFTLESRHLGLKMPAEIEGIRQKLDELGKTLEKTLDIDGLVKLAFSAAPLALETKDLKSAESAAAREKRKNEPPIRIGVAKDEAFCFVYPDNLSILEKLGAKIVPFSPLHDRELPGNLSGILLYGGYPELFAEKLSENKTLREQVRNALAGGMPCIAECGGFQYLQEYLETEKGAVYEMCGALKGRSYPMGRLTRFGYVTLKGGRVFGKDVRVVRAHEFHYYDSEYCGEDFLAQKPLSERNWKCMISTETMLAGYPHIHYTGNEKIAESFVEACGKYAEERTAKERR